MDRDTAYKILDARVEDLVDIIKYLDKIESGNQAYVLTCTIQRIFYLLFPTPSPNLKFIVLGILEVVKDWLINGHRDKVK